MEESWNDYDYDNSWGWNDNSYEDTANYIGGINGSHLTIGHIRQAKPLPHKRKSKALLGKKASHTTSWNDHSKSFRQFLQEDTTQLHFDIAAATQKQRNKKIEDTIAQYIMYSNFKSYHDLLIDSGGLRARSTTTTLSCGESVPQRYTVTNKKSLSTAFSMFPTSRIMMPYYVCDVRYPILNQDYLIEDRNSTSPHDTAPSHMDNNKHTSSDTRTHYPMTIATDPWWKH